MGAFVHGAVLAVGLILPLGIQNLFVFTQGMLQPNFWMVLPVVLAAACCDTLLIITAVTGVSLAILAFPSIRLILVFGGGIFLLYMGWVMWKSRDTGGAGPENSSQDWQRRVLFAVSVSLLNPHAILDTVGVIGTSSLQYSGAERWWFTVACVLVSWLWFFFLAITGRMLGSLPGSGVLFRRINQVSALCMWGAALYLIHSGVVSS